MSAQWEGRKENHLHLEGPSFTLYETLFKKYCDIEIKKYHGSHDQWVHEKQGLQV